jgi:hypothetical protein
VCVKCHFINSMDIKFSEFNTGILKQIVSKVLLTRFQDGQ